MTILDFAPTSRTSTASAAGTAGTATITAPRGTTTTQLHDSLWRVTRTSGEVLGYIERFTEARGIRYRAKRLIVRQQRFVAVGEFWAMGDALECFRAS
jgi:hypothetical protein